MPDFNTDRAFAASLDARDPLAEYRTRFHLPKGPDSRDLLYFCGNSLGLQPRSAQACVQEELEAWARLAVDGHVQARHPWLPYHEPFAESTARIVGARPQEVVVMNTLTLNLHLMLVSFYRPTPERHKILVENRPFPSDRYALASHIRFHGFDPESALVEAQPRPGETTLRTDDLLEHIERQGPEMALILFGGVNYYTGQAFDLQALTDAGHRQGCVVGFDLAHAAGNLVLHLHDWNVDFAVWCSYKYLNGGPGCVAGCFVHERHGRRPDLPRFAGWWGQNKATRFQMGPEFDPIPGAEGWQISNPPILSLAPLRASLEIFDAAGMPALRAKSEKLTGYLESLLCQRLGNDVEIVTPADPAQRGCQLSLRLKRHGKLVFDRLRERGVVCDWREPDVIRVAPVPLYNRFLEVFEFVERLAACL